MRVAHFCRFSPGRSGQYSTVKDLIKAEIEAGIDAGIVAMMEINGKVELVNYQQDDWLTSKDEPWARSADVFVRHTVIPPHLECLPKKKIMCLHGRPENSFMLGLLKKNPVYNIILQANFTNMYKRFITFWPDYLYNWSFLVPHDKLFYVPPPVDLDFYTPEGEKYDWQGVGGTPNLLIAELWREDTTPYNIIHAAALFKEKYCPEAKLHVFGVDLPPYGPTSELFQLLGNRNILGVVGPQVTGIERMYRGADIVLTPHTIATRIVRESMACGTPVVAGSGNPFTPYRADPRDIESYALEIKSCWEALKRDSESVKSKCRHTAQKEFHTSLTGKHMKQILEGL